MDFFIMTSPVLRTWIGNVRRKIEARGPIADFGRSRFAMRTEFTDYVGRPANYYWFLRAEWGISLCKSRQLPARLTWGAHINMSARPRWLPRQRSFDPAPSA